MQTFNDWKARLVKVLIDRGVKKKEAKKFADHCDEEFGLGFDPEGVADRAIQPVEVEREQSD